MPRWRQMQHAAVMQPHTTFVDARRVHTALTANYEKRFLEWLARRVPAAIHSDHLTALALAAQVFAGVAYAFGALWLVDCLLVLNWLGDSLDGTLARVRKQQRPRYGFYVDHVVDTLGALALMTGLGCSAYLHWPVAVALLLCFYVLAIESYLATYTMGHFHISHGLFGPTEIRLLLIAGNWFVRSHKFVQIGGQQFLLFDIGGVVAVAGMSLMAVLAMVRHAASLYRLEPRL